MNHEQFYELTNFYNSEALGSYNLIKYFNYQLLWFLRNKVQSILYSTSVKITICFYLYRSCVGFKYGGLQLKS